MAKTTSRLKLPYPEFADPASAPTDFQALASRLDSIVATTSYNSRSPAGFFNPAGSGETIWHIVSGHAVRVGDIVSWTITLNRTYANDYVADANGNVSNAVVGYITNANLRPANIALMALVGDTVGGSGRVYSDDGAVEICTLGPHQAIRQGGQYRFTATYPTN